MKFAVLTVYLVILILRLTLRRLQLRHLKMYGHNVPAGFDAVIDAKDLAKSTDYSVAQSRIGLVESLVGSLALLVFLFGGLLPLYDRWVVSLSDSFVLGGILFFFGLFLAQYLIDIPFEIHRTFVLEERFGFNTTSAGLWLSDQVKSLLISAVLGAVALGGAFALIGAAPQWWWLWVWGFFAVMIVFLMYLSPKVIEPLFFKFEPLRREGLEEKVKEVAAKAGLDVSRVYQVDASRRSRHSNAYFTGIGRVKRIVLFDTLLEQMDDREIVAVLAHEIGHWKKGHIRKRLLRLGAGGLVLFWVAHRLLDAGVLPTAAGAEALSFYGQAVVLFFLVGLAGFVLTPLFSGLSRRHEWEADRFAVDITGEGDALASALAKLSRENLANLHPHPLYAWFYYSHPPVVARVGRLRSARD